MKKILRWLLPALVLCFCGWLLLNGGGLSAQAVQLGDEDDDPAVAATEATEETAEEPAEDATEEIDLSSMTLDELREHIKANAIRQEQFQDQIKSLSGQISEYEGKVHSLSTQMSMVYEQIETIQAAIDAAQKLIDMCEQEIAAAEERLAQRRAMLQQRVVNLYVYGDVSMLDVVLGTDSFEDFLSVYDLTQLIMNQDTVLLEQIQAELQLIQDKKKEAEDTQAEQVRLMHDLEDRQADLRAMQKQYEEEIARLGLSKEEMESQWQEEVAAGEAAEAILRDMISDATLSFGGVFIWPLPAAWTYVSSDYGGRYHPIYGTWRVHTGIDIPADGGTSVYVVADGKVTYAAWLGGYGNCVMVDHGDGVVSLYGHLSGYGDHGVGEYVLTGDTIGYVGTTGASTGNHLHFEVRINGSHTSPWNYLK